MPDNSDAWWGAFSCIVDQLKGDIQSKLSFLAQKHVDSGLVKENFLPTLGQLDYPPIIRACELMDKLFPALPKQVFERISQECVLSVVHLLEDSFLKLTKDQKISARHYLYVIKHLLHLREQMTSYDVSFITKDIVLQFGDLKKAASELLKNRYNILSLSSNNALLLFILAGAPTLCERWLDSRKEIELKIRNYCFEFVKDCVECIAGPVKTLNALIGDVPDQADQSHIACELKSAVQEAYNTIRIKSAEIQEVMLNYLNSPDTVDILFKPIRTSVLQVYKILFDKVAIRFSDEEKLLISLPPCEQISLLLN